MVLELFGDSYRDLIDRVLAVHLRQMELHIVEGGGERVFPRPGLQHFDAILVAQDAGYMGAGA